MGTRLPNMGSHTAGQDSWPVWVMKIVIFLSVVTTVLVVAGRKPKATVPKDFKFKNHFNRSAPTEETFVLQNPGKRGPGRPKRQGQRDENQDRDVESGLGGQGEGQSIPDGVSSHGDDHNAAGPSQTSKPKPKRFFKAAWLESFGWISWDDMNEVAHCIFCRAAGQNNAFARGINFKGHPNFRKSSFQDHGKSSVHQDAAMSQIAPEVERSTGLKDGNIVKALEKAKRRGLEAKLRQLQGAYMIGKLGVAVTTTYPTLKDLAELWNVDLPGKHWSSVSAWEMFEALSYAEREMLKASLAEADGGFVGVIADESTANDNKQYLAIAIVWCKDAVKRVMFLALRHVAPATGENIAKIIVNELKDVMPSTWDIRRHLVCVGCDGASVMLGEVKGVAGILKSSQAPFVTAMHCAAHKVSLACKGFVKNDLYQKVDGCLRASYNLFARSPSMQERFKVYQDMFEVANQLLRIHDIRWLSIYCVLERWLEQYDALLIFLVSEGIEDDNLERVGEMMLDAEVLLGSRALQPLLKELHILIKEIQGSDFSFENLSKRIEHLQKFIRSHYDMKNGEGLIDEVFRNLIKIQASPSKLSPLAFNGPGGRLTYTSDAHRSYHNLTSGGKSITKESWQGCLDEILMKVCDIGRTLAEQLYERFPHTDLLDALSVLQASYWEKPQLVDLEDSVEVLVGFYGTEKLQIVGSSKQHHRFPYHKWGFASHTDQAVQGDHA
eukprot:jgi/Botrbrau1/8070/Bobra.13_2s0036.1